MELQDVAVAELDAIRNQLADVYREAFTVSPYDETEADAQRFASETLPQHAARDGFRLVVARQEGGEPIAGFAYGYHGAPGQWWYETVSTVIGPELTKQWMTVYFELVELAVTPVAQGQGIGGRLHDAVLSGLPYRTAMLTAFPDALPALRLYRGRGWQIVRERLSIHGVDRTLVLMGLMLARGG